MARPLRIEYPNACYHVINRGNQRAVVFHDDWHYQRFLDKLGYFADEFHVKVYSYCCMPNHFHLHLKTRKANLSRFMQSFLTSFCVSSNKKRRCAGHIFQGRFKAHLVEDECYRSRLSRYIHLNPIRTKTLRDATLTERQDFLREFNWSSYRHYMGVTKIPDWMNCRSILSCWGAKKREQMKNYAAYVEEGLLKNLESPFDEVVEQSIIGTDRFVDWVKRKYLLNRSGNKREEPALFHLQQSFSFDNIIACVTAYFGITKDSVLRRKSGHREARRVAMYFVCTYCRHGHSLSELASRFSVSGSALTQAKNNVAGSSSPGIKKVLTDLGRIIIKSKTSN